MPNLLKIRNPRISYIKNYLNPNFLATLRELVSPLLTSKEYFFYILIRS